MAPFPLIKLAYLAFRQVSKPLASYISRQAKSSPVFRKYVCIPPAQFYYWLEVNFRMRLLGLGTAQNVQKLSEKEAIELGGEMLGEMLVFFFAALIMFSEYQRGARKEAAKEEKRNQELMQILKRLKELETEGDIHESQIRDLQHRMDSIFPEKELNRANQSGSFFRTIWIKTT